MILDQLIANYGKEKKQINIHLCPIEMKKSQYTFLPADYPQITQAITKKIPLQKLLKMIHHNFKDQGLTYTLIHRIYESTENQVAYYVPQLVYIAVKKMCRPMKTVLVFKTSASINLRRLILWNIKAFTVLMIQRDQKLKKFIEQFQQEIIKNVVDHKKFEQSQKAISMLANASLILKKMPKQQIKDKLKRFIKRYNCQILNNIQHAIFIPFRQNQYQKNINSTYVVRLVEQNCSCFPTRKRVPYRIILQTIDVQQLKSHKQMIKSNFFKIQKTAPDKQRDLFDQVRQQVEKSFKMKNQMKFKDANKYPFVVDQQQSFTINELNKFAKKVQSQEKKKQKDKDKDKDQLRQTQSPGRKGPIMRRETLAALRKSRLRSSKFDQPNLVFNKGKFQIKDNEQLRKYEAIYIPTLPSNLRKSDIGDYPRGIWITVDRDNPKKRLSLRNPDSQKKNVKQIEQQVQYDGNNNQSVFKQPWNQTIKMLKQTSPFKKFNSLRFRNMVVKGGDDLRQQIICMQLIYKMRSIINDAKVDVFIKPYQIIVLSENSGMLQFVSNSISIDGMKKQMQLGVHQFYAQVFNTEQKFLAAKQNFIRSLAGSSILTYILKLKDRHNGNILIDIDGNIIHIDFGFILGMSPGGINFQSSPFKFTQEYLLLMGGKDSPDYMQFVDIFCQGMSAIRKRCDQLCLILQIMMEQSDLQCFQGFRIQGFRQRFQQKLSEQKFRAYCQGLIQRSCLNSRTVHYDTFQKITNGIMP